MTGYSMTKVVSLMADTTDAQRIAEIRERQANIRAQLSTLCIEGSQDFLLAQLDASQREIERLRGVLQRIRQTLGDFGEPWSHREREVDETARQALQGGESHGWWPSIDG